MQSNDIERNKGCSQKVSRDVQHIKLVKDLENVWNFQKSLLNL